MITKIYTRKNIETDSYLEFDSSWNVSHEKKPKTLQYFITSRCNYRCSDCFFQNFLGKDEVNINDYKRYVEDKVKNEGLEKINFLGGEPTLHKDLGEAIKFNHELGIRTHIYSNGAKLNKIDFDLYDSKIRLSVLSYNDYKPITKIKTDLPLTIVYPLKKDNIKDIPKILEYSRDLNVSEFVFSTIKKLESEGDFFTQKNGCLSSKEYIDFLNSFFKKKDHVIPEFHINSRGIFDLGMNNTSCNFINKLTDSRELNCPFDIDINNIGNNEVSFGSACSKNDVCLLEKIVVKKN